MNQAEYYIAVFKSRNQTMKYYNTLKGERVRCEIVNTPRQVSLGCGLSVRFESGALSRALAVLRRLNLYSYGGMFAVSQGMSGPVYTPRY